MAIPLPFFLLQEAVKKDLCPLYIRRNESLYFENIVKSNSCVNYSFGLNFDKKPFFNTKKAE